jgi:hypothetical protein
MHLIEINVQTTVVLRRSYIHIVGDLPPQRLFLFSIQQTTLEILVNRQKDSSFGLLG